MIGARVYSRTLDPRRSPSSSRARPPALRARSPAFRRRRRTGDRQAGGATGSRRRCSPTLPHCRARRARPAGHRRDATSEAVNTCHRQCRAGARRRRRRDPPGDWGRDGRHGNIKGRVHRCEACGRAGRERQGHVVTLGPLPAISLSGRQSLRREQGVRAAVCARAARRLQGKNVRVTNIELGLEFSLARFKLPRPPPSPTRKPPKGSMRKTWPRRSSGPRRCAT